MKYLLLLVVGWIGTSSFASRLPVVEFPFLESSVTEIESRFDYTNFDTVLRDDTYQLTDSLNILKKTNPFVRVGDSFVHTLTSPIRWKKEEWLTTGAIIGGTALISVLDEPVKDFMMANQNHVSDQIERVGFHNGKPYAAFIATGGFLLAGVIIDDEWTKETALILGSAYMTSGLIQTAMKKMVGRARPGREVGPYKFKPFMKADGYSSFPSGHVQIALVTSMVLAERVDQVWLKGIFYTGAAVTVWSRMYDNAHWLSDVTFGSIISYYCTKAVIKRLESNKYNNPLEKKDKQDKIQWQVNPSFNGIGIIGVF